MRRWSIMLVLMLPLALIAVACAEAKDTGFPAPSPTETADEHGGGGGGEEEFEAEPQTEPATSLDIKAKNIKFNRQEMRFVAEQAITLTFENLDAVQHNVAIYPSDDETSQEQGIFIGEIFTGPDEREYAIPATPAGEYFFRCDVHPDMKGTATFE